MSRPDEARLAPELTLCWGTVRRTSLLELIEAASGRAEAISVTPAHHVEARAAGHEDRELRRRLDDAGLRVSFVDPLLRGLPGTPPPRAPSAFRHLFDAGEDQAFACAHALGCEVVNVAHYLGAPTPVDELTDAFGELAARARRHGLRLLLEFMPEGGVPDLAAATAIVEGSGAPDAAVMVDTWHQWRTTPRTDDVAGALAGLPVGGLQLSDAPDRLRGAGTAARIDDRLLPGIGSVPLHEIVATVRERGRVDWPVPIGIEVFDAELASAAPPLAADRAVTATRAALSPGRAAGPGRDASAPGRSV